MNPHDPLLDHRARTEQLQFETQQRRSRALIDQCSPENSHETRVRLWEQLHQVRLPKSPEHAVLRVIAEQTGLDLADVQAVQRARVTTLP
jgi:hypothetical protein